MQPIEDAQHPEAVIKLEVVKVVRLWTGEEGKVVARVCTQRVADGHGEPQPGSCDVAAHYKNAQERG